MNDLQPTIERPDGASRSRIGNDVMDLRDPRCRGRRRDDPLLDRVLQSAERLWMEEAVTDEMWSVRLWALWAAKESAFKVHCKLAGGGPFFPRALTCRLETVVPSEDDSVVRIRGSVRRTDSDIEVVIQGSSNGSYVHLVGWDGSAERPNRGRLEIGLEEFEAEASEASLETLRDRFTPEEWAGIYSLRSARARILARDRVRAHLPRATEAEAYPGPGPVEIRSSGARPGQSPPRIWFEGREVPDLDLSLSHHGRFVAWALLVPEED